MVVVLSFVVAIMTPKLVEAWPFTGIWPPLRGVKEVLVATRILTAEAT